MASGVQKAVVKSMPLKTASWRATPAILAVLSVMFMGLHKSETLPVERIRTALLDMMAPALTVISAPFTYLADNVGGMSALHDMKAENIRLTEENAKLQKWYDTALRLQAENESFRQLLNVKADPTVTFVTARVISDAGGSFVKSVLLPIGVSDKIEKGNAVMSGQGLVGRVMEVGNTASRVLLITDLNSHIPIILQDTRTKAILAGQNSDLMKLERLPPDSGLSVGTRIVTSGDGGQLPANLPVGTIVKIDASGVWVKPLSDIDRLTHVQVVNAEMDQSLITGDIAPK